MTSDRYEAVKCGPSRGARCWDLWENNGDDGGDGKLVAAQMLEADARAIASLLNEAWEASEKKRLNAGMAS